MISRLSSRMPLGVLMILLSTVFYGAYGVFYHLIQEDFGAFLQIGIRSALVVAVLGFIMWMRHEKWEPIRWRKDAKWLLGFVVSSCMIGAPSFYAVSAVGVGISTMLLYAGYVISMFALGKLINHERFDAAKMWASILAIMGVLLVFIPEGGNRLDVLGCLAALFGGVGIGLDMAISKNVNYGTSQTTVMTWAAGILPNLLIGILLHEHVASILADAVPWMYLLGFVVVSIASSWASVYGVKRVEVGYTGILGLLEIVWAVVFGIILFHERPSLLAYFGLISIITAAALPYLKKRDVNIIEEVMA